MKTIIKAILVAALFMLATTPLLAQAQKIAYVNSETILREIPEAQVATKELESAVKGWQDELEKMAKDFQEQYDDYQKKQALLDPTTKSAKEKSLQEMNQKMQQYRLEKFDPREGEAVKLREKK
ncbi:MAG: OmpH family outer membrane protein, partial [Ignavibacteriales bacterium]|nr:OmpH family outer membrane protein [Ignavibacteriales bacterium]